MKAKNIIKKKCSKCHRTKSVDMFYNNKRMPDGYACYCKQCSQKYVRKYREENKERIAEKKKISDSKKKDRIAAYNKLYYAQPDNAERQAAYQKKYKVKNREKLNAYQAEWRKKNKKKIKEREKQYYQKNKEKIAARRIEKRKVKRRK